MFILSNNHTQSGMRPAPFVRLLNGKDEPSGVSFPSQPASCRRRPEGSCRPGIKSVALFFGRGVRNRQIYYLAGRISQNENIFLKMIINNCSSFFNALIFKVLPFYHIQAHLLSGKIETPRGESLCKPDQIN